jgi:hypothetical protein
MFAGHSRKPRAQPSMIVLGCLLAVGGIGLVAWEMLTVQPMVTSSVSNDDCPGVATIETLSTGVQRAEAATNVDSNHSSSSKEYVGIESPEIPSVWNAQPMLFAADYQPSTPDDWFPAPITDRPQPGVFKTDITADRLHQSDLESLPSGVHDSASFWTVQPSQFAAEPVAADPEDAEARPRESDSEPTPASESASSSESEAPERLGVPPPRPQPQFLRDQSVLLSPGEYQFELGFSYNHNVTEAPISIDLEEGSVVTQLRTVTSTFLTPMEFRLGVQPGLQGFISVPLGYSKQQLVIANLSNTEEEWGIGDVGFGLTKVLREPQLDKPTFLGNFGVTAPTGKANIPAAQQLPGVVLGSGFWTITTGLVAIRSFDPVVTFASLNFTYTFDASIGDLSLSPGNIVSYRFGMGYAVNSRVTLSTAFTGAHIGGIRLDGRYLSGTAREPFSLRLAATIVDRERRITSASSGGKRATEPFVNLGLSQAAPEVIFGIRWTF